MKKSKELYPCYEEIIDLIRFLDEGKIVIVCKETAIIERVRIKKAIKKIKETYGSEN